MPIYALDGVGPELPEDGDYWIAPTATLIGRVRLKKGASVWFGAVLRGDKRLDRDRREFQRPGQFRLPRRSGASPP